MIGTTIGNYIVRDKIGEGGMGAVYLAEHTRLGRRVAVKVLLPQLGRSPDVVARFFNEAKAATDIKNEHIIDVLDFGELPDGTSYIVMEWLEGHSLADVIREGRMPVARAVHVAEGIGKALAAAHARGIVHRDLKPDNVFLVPRDGDPDFVKVLDFGIAKLSNAGDVHTQTGAFMGTPLYMSPEQINGANVDARTDVYALGILVYQMITGTLPFMTTTLTELLLAHATKTPPPLRAHDPSIPPAIENAVLQALEKDPGRRFASVDAFVGALAGIAPAPMSALASTFAPPSAPAPSKMLPVIFAASGAVVLGIVGVVFAVMSHSPSETSDAAIAIGPPPPSSVTPAPTTAASTVDHWKLGKTDCPPNAVPKFVETTHTGAAIVSRAAGFPDSVGTTSPDGTFRVHNALGTCSGTGTERLVTETCTNAFNLSCHATYERAD